MKTKNTVVEKYNKELQKIKEQIELLKAGEIWDIQLITRIENLAIKTYYDGKSDSLNEMRKIYKS